MPDLAISIDLLPSDWITIFYLSITAVLIAIFRKNLARWPIYLLVHIALVIGILSLSAAPKALPPVLQVLRDAYPLATIPAFYWGIAQLTQLIFRDYFDSLIVRWDDWLFKIQPSIALSKRYPSVILSEFLHLCYFSYYGIVVFLGAVLYLQGRYDAFHNTVFAEIFTFNVCLIWYIFMPVTGPRYDPEKIGGTLANGFFYKLTHAILSRASSKGTAFPSSHVAIAVVVLLCAARYDLISFLILLPLCVGLVIGTVYGRFHYAADAIAGTVLGCAIFCIAPTVYQWLLKG